MKRFHVHAHVDDLPASIAFYSKLFGAEPTRSESDYAKWMLDDPRINFANWVTDPQGIAWEHFHTLGDIPVFSEKVANTAETVACCATATPLERPVGVVAKARSSCC